MHAATATRWRELLAQPAHEAAPHLLGARLATPDGIVVSLVEVEAYGGVGEDPASHAFRGRTARNQPMFGPPGHLYVYLSYGMHLCVNMVAHAAGAAAGVLLRAAAVEHGEDIVRTRRGWSGPASALASGPGRFGQAVGISRADSGADAFAPAAPLALVSPPAPLPEHAVARGPRVGISQGADRPWRFWIAGHPSVSRAR